MQSRLVCQSSAQVEADLLVIPITRAAFDARAQGALAGISATLDFDIFEEAASERFEGKKGQSFLLRGLKNLGTRRVLLLGAGDVAQLQAGNLRQVGVTAAKRARTLRALSVAIALPVILPEGLDDQRIAGQLLEGFCHGAYAFDRYVSAREDRFEGSQHLIIVAPEGAALNDDALTRSRVLADAICMARNLVNEPPAAMTPNELALRAEAIATTRGLEHHILGPTALEEGQFNLLLAVGRGSDNSPRMIHLIYRPEGEVKRRIAFVGKGVTFDTGGYSLKLNMANMHSDMAGGAAVLGAADAIGALKPAGLEIHFIVPAAENCINGAAIKVQDIVRGYGKKTVEILNTDAEGRLILADALAYAQEQDVDTIIDLATLTGASVVALGDYTAALFSSSESLASSLLSSARASGEDLWRMPLTERLDKQLDSPVADMKNLGKREGGAISAALFLRRWVNIDDWAHLDIAGPAFMSTDDEYYGQGATGYGVATLVDYACRLA
ncbi:MAG: leucyl aminopeptidase [Bradymonadaceae bacterium]|nr:leucyl aminopeptidase [Lujinxingiaceae bacterium]